MNWVEEQLQAYEERVYGGEMPPQNKHLMRTQLRAEEKFWERFERDFTPGKDDGENPKGAEW